MKRYNHLFPQIVELDNIRRAFRRARRGKSWQNTVQRIEAELEERLQHLQWSLIDHTFTTSEYRAKIIHIPKTRTIYRLPFYPDRIVQHALMNVLEPIWDKRFDYHSYACRAGKGIHAASRHTMTLIRSHRYCLKCDVSKFYPSIDHDILFGILQRKIRCRDTLWLLRDIIYSPGGGMNVPIGNYTSQWFANLYLNELDRFIRDVLKIRAYVRYSDDFCLFHNDKAVLNSCACEIQVFVAASLRLSLSKCDLFPVSRGVDFLGYRHFPTHILLRKTTAKRVKKRLSALPELFSSGRVTREQYRSSIASTMGWLKWANTHNLRRSLGLDALWRLGHATA